uniref:Si:dkeyp-27e10.3 n=1 Tax=Tetraodon nigroviridis TaxID=99883 RepID=H3CCS0_TETNG
SDVSEHLRKLSLVEFSFYLGFPVLQIAEPLHYPELNTSHHLRSTWVRTVLLEVPEQQVAERSFRARLERRLALLLQEGLRASSRRRWRRATAAGNHSLQVARVAMLGGAERPLEVFYFVEGPGGERIPAEAAAAAINGVDPQRAAIILGHRVRKPVAQPAETAPVPPAETHSSSIWLIVGVIVPILLALFIVVILYWKLCGSEKLEFQPDAVNAVQQRQKLQAPSVKGFDFAKLHLGQHSKDDMLVIQEPGPLPAPAKEATPSDAGDLNTPKSKSSSNKGARSGRRRGRLSPSDGDSLGSDQSSARESAEESARAVATPTEGKQHRRTPRNGQKNLPSTPDEFLSSTSIFDHVDRLSRGSADGLRRQGNKVQLIAMQPQPSPPHAASQPSPSLTEKPGPAVVLQVALRHKSEIEHHRNKLRQRAKRRGQCEFPSMDDIMDAFGDGPVQGEAAQRLYSSAHDHMDCMVPSDGPSPTDSRRRSPCRGRSSPRGRRAQPGLGSLPDTDRDRDRDRLLAEQSATYRKYPGLNNVAYMSDPDLPPDRSSPSPSDESLTPRPPRRPTRPPGPPSRRRGSSMHSLLDDAFALVSPSSQGSAGVSGVSPALPSPVPQARPPGRQWGSYPAVPAHSPFSSRYAELGMSPTSVQGLLQRWVSGTSGRVKGGLVATGDQLQESLYPSRGQYEDAPCPSRPPPVGGSTSVHFQQLTQVGLSSQMGAYPVVGRSMSGPTGSSWNQPHPDQDQNPPRASRESVKVLSFPEFSSSSVFQMAGSSLQDSAAPPLLLSSPAPDSPPEDASPSAHSSASLIKAIREELQRLAHKQAAVTSY